jgi:hypothetical protein
MAEPTLLRADAVQSAALPPVFKVELDERCLAFPDGKILQHLLIGGAARNQISIDAVFAFNRTRHDPRIALLTLAEARDFAKELANAVYTARTGFVLSDTLKITINVIANGYNIEIVRAEERREIMFSTGVIWRVIKALLLAIDSISPVVSN